MAFPDDRVRIKKCVAPGILLCLIKMGEWADERRDCEGVYSWRRSVRFVYNTRNTQKQTIKMLPHKIWLNFWLHNTFSTNLTHYWFHLWIHLYEFCTHKNPCLFQFYGSSAKWVLVSNCNNLALQENRKQNNVSTARQSYLHNPCTSVIHS